MTTLTLAGLSRAEIPKGTQWLRLPSPPLTKNWVKDPVLTIMLHAPLLLSLFAQERCFYCFPGFCFSRGKHSIAWKEFITSCASGLFKLVILKNVLKCCLINKVHE